MWHLYEIAISNSRMWLKIQASCSSSEQSAAFFESRFNGTDYILDEHRPVTPFRLSQRSHHIANWASIVDRLPVRWDDDEFHIVGTPYPWCATLSDDCDCHGSDGRLDAAYCSDLGLREDTTRRASPSPNIRHLEHLQQMRRVLVNRQIASRANTKDTDENYLAVWQARETVENGLRLGAVDNLISTTVLTRSSNLFLRSRPSKNDSTAKSRGATTLTANRSNRERQRP